MDMILVCQRRPNQRHDFVARHLVDRPVVLVKGLHHEREHHLEDFQGFFGISPGNALQRLFELRAQHRNVLAGRRVQPFRPQALANDRLIAQL